MIYVIYLQALARQARGLDALCALAHGVELVIHNNSYQLFIIVGKQYSS